MSEEGKNSEPKLTTFIALANSHSPRDAVALNSEGYHPRGSSELPRELPRMLSVVGPTVPIVRSESSSAQSPKAEGSAQASPTDHPTE